MNKNNENMKEENEMLLTELQKKDEIIENFGQKHGYKNPNREKCFMCGCKEVEGKEDNVLRCAICWNYAHFSCILKRNRSVWDSLNFLFKS